MLVVVVILAWVWPQLCLPGSFLPQDALGSLCKPGQPPALAAPFPRGTTVGQPPSSSPTWALAVKPAGLVSSSPAAWKASSNEQPERDRSSVEANRRCCRHAAALAHTGCQLGAGSGTAEALPYGPAQGMGAAGDPVLSPLGGEGGPILPAAAPGQVGNAPGSHRGPPSHGAEDKGLGSWTPEPRRYGVGAPRRKGTRSWEWPCAGLLRSRWHPSIPAHSSAPSPVQLELVPWVVPSWGHAGDSCSGSEDPASDFQPIFIHGQFKPITPVPTLCASPAVLRPPQCSSSQRARRDRACPLQLMRVHGSPWGPPQMNSRVCARGAEPSSPPQPLALHPQPGHVPCCLP